jgi:hypothetical protein
VSRVIAFDPAELASLPLHPATLGCDFCTDCEPRWTYPCRNVGLGMIIYGTFIGHPISLGGWRSCDGCSDLIEHGDWPALARRTLRSLDVDLSKAGPGTRVKLLGAFHQAHVQFQRARNGAREAT